MQVTRRQFLQAVGSGALALGLSQAQILKFAEVMARASGPVEVIWLQGQNCTGCTTSFAGLEWDGKPEALPGDVQDYLDVAHFGGVSWPSTLQTLGAPASVVDDGKTTIDDVLLDIIDLKFNSTIMATAGAAAEGLLRGWMTTNPAAGVTRVLIVEGSIPTNAAKYCGIAADIDGVELSVASAVKEIAARSGLVLAVGTCAAFGGIPAGASAPGIPTTGAKDVQTYLTSQGVGTLVVNVPGCPIHPDWLFGTIVHYLLGSFAGAANLDSFMRPTFYYGKTNHGGRCPRYQAYCDGQFALYPGQSPAEGGRVHAAGLPSTTTANLGTPYDIPLCLDKLGCKGLSTGADCAFGGPGTIGMKGRGWNVTDRDTTGANAGNPKASCGNSCINNGHPCMGCTEKGFPDKYSPFFAY
jgi:hydrogenase small subunit